MNTVNRSYSWLSLGIFLSILVTCPRVTAQSNTRPIVLKGARLIDGTGRQAIENSVLIIEGDHVVAVLEPARLGADAPRRLAADAQPRAVKAEQLRIGGCELHVAACTCQLDRLLRRRHRFRESSRLGISRRSP